MGEQKNLCTAYNMKLQFIFLASTLALTFSKNIPKPALNKETKNNVNKLAKNAVKSVNQVLKKNGVEVKNLQGRINSALNAGSLQVKNVEGKANEEYNKVAGKTVGELIDIAANTLDNTINEAEKDAPDGAKVFIDFGQDLLKAFKKIGKDSLGEKANLTVDKLAKAGSEAVEENVNDKETNKQIKDANQKLNK